MGKTLTKYNGHVMSSLMEFVDRSIKIDQPHKEIPKGWSVKSRCTPNPIKCIRVLLEELEQLEGRVRRKAQKAGAMKEEESGMKLTRLQEKLMSAFEEDTRRDGPQIEEEEEVNRVRRMLKGFVVAPVDKLSGDAAIM